MLCATTTAPKTSHKYKGLKHLIEHGYHHNWLVDSLPAAAVTDSEDGETTSYSRGVPVGYVDKDKDKIYVYNHVQLIVKYHETQNGARVVNILHAVRREPPLVVARVPGPGDDGLVCVWVRGLLLRRAPPGRGLRRGPGGPLLRVFFGYMALVALGVALVAGAAGFLASLKFLAYIFAQIKFD